jgi:cyclophilin family peptidyl-prolyl cis-trans isomerase
MSGAAAPERTTVPEIPDPSGSSPRTTKFDDPPPMIVDAEKRYTAEMVTSKGTIVISLDPIGAPQTTNNFVFLSRFHYYDGIVFHRVIPGFVLQGGDPTGTGTGGPGYRFADELPKPGRYELGSLAMANAGPDTNGSQFFIISGPQGVALPPKYALFGKVVSGLDVVAAIEAIGTASGTPSERVVIESVTITESD